MLPIYICEDNPVQLNRYSMVINNVIMMEEYDAKLYAAVTHPEELLETLYASQQQNGITGGFYLLDIDLNSDMTGFELAQSIRKLDSRGFIVFITTHSELAMLTFQYQVEAMDYILKDESWKINERIRSCLEEALRRNDTALYAPKIAFRSGSNTININQNSILYITVSGTPHKVLVVTTTGVKEFSSTLQDCLTHLSDNFIRCHKAYIVNIQYIEHVDRKSLTLTLTDGQTCIASTRGIMQVIDAIHSHM